MFIEMSVNICAAVLEAQQVCLISSCNLFMF